MRRVALARAVYGTVLLVVADGAVRAASGEESGVAATVARVLSVRHLLQALTLDRSRSRGLLAVGVGSTSCIHAVCSPLRRLAPPTVGRHSSTRRWPLAGRRVAGEPSGDREGVAAVGLMQWTPADLRESAAHPAERSPDRAGGRRLPVGSWEESTYEATSFWELPVSPAHVGGGKRRCRRFEPTGS